MKRWFVIGLVCTLLLTSCGADAESSGVTTEAVSTDSVKLSDVNPPAFEEDFCTLSFDNSYLSIRWGAGTGCVMWKESGYPGFDYPMIVATNQPVNSSEVSLTTGWGSFVYSKVSEGTAYKEANNLLDKEVGSPLVDWAHAEEDLVLWNESSGYYSLYKFKEGTEIVE